MSTPAYRTWQEKPTPDNLALVMAELEPTINAEIHRYPGPKPLLRGKAKSLAINAIKTYNPDSGAHLRSWVVTQMQPLSRYGQKLRPVHASEMAIRQAAEVNRRSRELADELGYAPSDEELADHIGITVKRINDLRRKVKPIVSEGSLDTTQDSDEPGVAPGVDQPRDLSGVEEALYSSLDARDKMIFDAKTGKRGKQMSNQEIARRLGVTPALISQRSQSIAQQFQHLNDQGVM